VSDVLVFVHQLASDFSAARALTLAALLGPALTVQMLV